MCGSYIRADNHKSSTSYIILSAKGYYPTGSTLEAGAEVFKNYASTIFLG